MVCFIRPYCPLLVVPYCAYRVWRLGMLLPIKCWYQGMSHTYMDVLIGYYYRVWYQDYEPWLGRTCLFFPKLAVTFRYNIGSYKMHKVLIWGAMSYTKYVCIYIYTCTYCIYVGLPPPLNIHPICANILIVSPQVAQYHREKLSDIVQDWLICFLYTDLITRISSLPTSLCWRLL